ncbi:MAG: M48 family metallopeptidase [Thermoflavifilum sp.]|nr:M48 family metallopeptidase [Thermoflavifilum sp.]MCL6514185.1 M48 family metallopeptidase [Alicyclobacillus sp.]
MSEWFHIGSFPVFVVRSQRRLRTLALEVTPSGIRLRAPLRISLADLQAWAQQRQGWLEIAWQQQRQRHHTSGESGTPWRWLGQLLPCQHQPGDHRWHCQWDGQRLTVFSPAGVSQADVDRRIAAWLRTQASALLRNRVADWAKRLQMNYGQVRIKDQRTRWGSCSNRGNLNFNWRLVMAPEFVLDYVVVHELCHLREWNHSPRFWSLVEQAFPAYRTARQWLREEGGPLLALGLDPTPVSKP